MARDIADLQVAYCNQGDDCTDEDNWHCSGSAAGCPGQGSFEPMDVDLVRLTLVTRSSHSVVGSDNSTSTDRYCRPDVENRDGGGECGYKYYTYTVEFQPRNNVDLGLN
jgi:hypothetical protein